MTTANAVTGIADSPLMAGLLAELLVKGLAEMTPAARSALLADAGTRMSTVLKKASEHFMRGDDSERIGMVEDQWDGPPDDPLVTDRAGGPDSKVPSGKVGIGNPESASGDGAEKMERTYSRHAPQTGVQLATEKLGRELAAMKSAVKSMLEAFQLQNSQIEVLKSTVAALTPAASLETTIAKAVEKAMRGARLELLKAVRKAESEKDDEKDSESGEEDEESDEEADEEADQSESGGEVEIEIDNEVEEEDESEAESDEDEKAKAKHAARQRLLAKNRVRLAKGHIRKARDMSDGMEDEKPFEAKKRKKHHKMAKAHLNRASAFLATAKSLRGGRIGPSTEKLASDIAKARKALAPAQSDNQKIWPASEDKKIGKAQEPAAGPDLAAAMDRISKALEGNGLLVTSVQKMMETMAGRSRGAAAEALPPVFSIAKSLPTIEAKEAEIRRMAESNIISFDDADRAIDTVGAIKRGMPDAFINAKINGLPEPVQLVLRQAA